MRYIGRHYEWRRPRRQGTALFGNFGLILASDARLDISKPRFLGAIFCAQRWLSVMMMVAVMTTFQCLGHGQLFDGDQGRLGVFCV
jgi:hypothetical protein